MPQKFGPWDDAVTRETYQKIIAIITAFRTANDEFVNADDVVNAICEEINQTEGTDL